MHELGADVGMDDIATHIGCQDGAVPLLHRQERPAPGDGARIFESTILPRLTSAITDDAGRVLADPDRDRVYVTSVADEPNLYRFAPDLAVRRRPISADSEKLVIELITVLITMRLTERGADISGVGVWAHALVGSITRSVDWWMAEGGDSVGR